MFKKSISLILSIIMLMAMCVCTPVSYAEGEINFTLDFNSIYPASYTAEQFASHTGLTTTAESGGGLWVDGSTDSGADRRAKFTHTGQGSEVKLYHNLNGQQVKKDVLSMGYKLSATEVAGNGNLSLFAFFSGTNVARTLVYWAAGNGAGALRVEGSTTNLAPVAVNNMYSLRADVYRATEDDDWTLKVYDDNAAVTTVLYETTLSKDTFPYFDKVRVCSTYGMDETEYYVIDDVFIKTSEYVEPPEAPVIIDWSQDFTEVTATAYSDTTFYDNTGLTTSKDGNTALYVTEDGEVKVHAINANGSSSSYSYVLPTAVTKNALSASFKFSDKDVLGNSSTTNITMLAFFNGDLKQETIAMTGKNAITGVTQAPTKDENEYYNLRAVAQRKDETEDWQVTIYDDVPTTPVAVYTGTLSKDTFTSIDKVRICSMYSSTKDCTFYFDDIAIKTSEYVEPPEAPVIIDFFQDFNSMIKDFHSAATFTSGSGLTTSKDDGTGLKIDEEGRVYFYHLGVGSSAEFDYVLPAQVKKGGLSVSYKLSGEEAAGSGKLNMFLFYSGTEKVETINYRGTDKFMIGDSTDLAYMPERDENGFYHLRADIYRETKDGDWTLDVYDELPEIPITMYSTTLPANDFPYIDKVRIVSTYAQSPSDEFVFDDVRVKTFEDYETYSGKISLDFDNLFEGAWEYSELNWATDITYTETGASIDVVKEGDNGKLKLSHTGEGQRVVLKYAIPMMRKGTIEFSAKFDQDGTSDPGVWYTSSFFNGTTKETLVERHGASNFKNAAQDEFKLIKDSNTNMYHLRTVVSRNSIDSDWTYTIWGVNEDSEGESVKVDEGTLSKDDFAKIDAIGFVSSYSMGNTNIIVDDIEISYYQGVTLDNVFFKSNETVIDKMTAGLTDLTAYVNLHSSDAAITNVTVIMGVYSGKGRLLAVSALPVEQLSAVANEEPLTITVSDFTTDTDSYAKLFFVEDFTSIRPLRAAGGLFSDGFCE